MAVVINLGLKRSVVNGQNGFSVIGDLFWVNVKISARVKNTRKSGENKDYGPSRQVIRGNWAENKMRDNKFICRTIYSINRLRLHGRGQKINTASIERR